jgi:hypothetical protein
MLLAKAAINIILIPIKRNKKTRPHFRDEIYSRVTTQLVSLPLRIQEALLPIPYPFNGGNRRGLLYEEISP